MVYVLHGQVAYSNWAGIQMPSGELSLAQQCIIDRTAKSWCCSERTSKNRLICVLVLYLRSCATSLGAEYSVTWLPQPPLQAPREPLLSQS